MTVLLIPDCALIIILPPLSAKDRQQLVFENLALHHQLAGQKRSVTRPNINDRDRISWPMVMRTLKEWLPGLDNSCSQWLPRWAGNITSTRESSRDEWLTLLSLHGGGDACPRGAPPSPKLLE